MNGAAEPPRRAEATLEARYDRFFAALGRGDRASALEHLSSLVGLALPSPEPSAEPPLLVSMLGYDRVREVDVKALVGGARQAAKFEDLSDADARRLAHRLRAASLRVQIVGPYSKRFDVTESRDGALPAADRFVVLASRGDEAGGIAEAERDRGPEGARRAGLLLGYPPCCVERFVEVSQRADTEREGLNEATLRDFVGDGDLPWQLNPLSFLSPVGFTPCRARCPEAMAFAERVLEAVVDGADQARVFRETLSRPVLFLRFPLFWVLGGAEAGPRGGVSFRVAALNDDKVAALAPLRQLGHESLGRLLSSGGELSLDERYLSFAPARGEEARLSVLDPRVPRLLRFT